MEEWLIQKCVRDALDDDENAAGSASALEDEIERRGLEARYVAALGGIVPHYQAYLDDAVVYPVMGVWAFIRATPEQRARAFLQAVEG